MTLNLSLPFPAYMARQELSSSDLENIRRSPLFYRYRREHPTPDTDAMRLGRAVHCSVLEPDRFRADYVRCDLDKRTKGYAQIKRECPGREILRAEEYDWCVTIRTVLHDRPASRIYLSRGDAEVSLFWTESRHGIRCKSRVDWLRNECICDLKTTRDVSPVQFGRQAYNLGYHRKAAFYHDAVFAETGARLPFVIIAVESHPPHDVVVYTLPERVIEQGRDEIYAALDTYHECVESNRWPGVAEGDVELELPAWAYTQEEPVELLIGGESVTL